MSSNFINTRNFKVTCCQVLGECLQCPIRLLRKPRPFLPLGVNAVCGHYSLSEIIQLEPSKTNLAYLHPWECHITYVEDNRIREVALEGPEASARAKAV